MILHNFDNSANNGGLLSKIGVSLNGIPKDFESIGRESAEAFSQSFNNGFSLQGLKSLPKNLKESLSVPITNVEDLYKRNFVFTDNVTPFLKNEDVFKNFDDAQAKQVLATLQKTQSLVDANTKTWDDYFQELSQKNTETKDTVRWQKELVQNNELEKLTTEDVIASYQQAYEEVIKYNNGLKSLTVSSKLAKIGAAALVTSLNMLATLAITALVKAIDNHIHRVEKAKEAVADSRSEYEEATSDLESMNSELENTNAKMKELENKESLSFTDKEELDKLKEQNNELERSIALKEKEKQSKAEKTVSTFKAKQSTLDKDFDSNLAGYKNYKQTYNQDKRLGQEYLAQTGNIEYYRSTLDAEEEILEKKKDKLLKNIEEYEQYKQDLINKYGNQDIDSWNISDKDSYQQTVDRLNQAYQQVYSKSEYNKFIIEPIFDTEKFNGLQEKLTQYFSTGGSLDIDALKEKFGDDIITALQQACELAGIDFSQMLKTMSTNATNKLQRIAPLIEKPNSASDAKQNQRSQQIRDFINNDLSQEDRTLLLNAKIPDNVEFETIEELRNFISMLQIQVTNDPIEFTSFKDAWKSIPEDTGNALTELAKAGELTAKTFHSTSGADEWAKSFKNLGLTTDDIVAKINQMQNSADQLSSMKTGISGIAQILGQKKSNLSSKKTRNDGIGADVLAGLSDEVKQNKKEYEEFCEVLGNGNSTMEDCRKASNKLASAYVNSSNFLAKLTPETKAYYTSVLDEMGVENASHVVKDTLAKKNELLAAKKKYLAEQGENVANAEAKDITKFAESKNYSDQLTNSLLLLAMRKKLVNGTQLNFDSDIGQIKSFVKAIGAQITALNALQNWKRNQSKLQGMPEDVRQIKKQEYMKDAQKEVDAAVKKAEKGTKVKVDVTPDISNTGSGGNSKNNKSSKDKSKDSKQEIDWIARKLEVLQKAIDTTSGKLQNLFSIKAKKNNINKQITETTAILNANRKAAKAYTAEANNVKLGRKLKAKVRSGDYDITKYDSNTADKINKYQDLIDKAREAQNAVQDNIASIHDLNQQKLDNITTWYDKLLEKIDAVTSKLQAKSDLTAKVRGMLGQAETGTKTEYTDTLKNQKLALKISQTELKKYEAERKAQRKKLVNKNKSKRQTTKDRLKRSGLSKKAINKKLKKFDKKNGKQLADFDTTTKSQSAKLKENVYSAMSEMLDTAQSLANIPLEKLSVTLDKLSTQFTVLENQASRATKEIENAGTGLDYYTRKSQAQIDNKSSAQYKARLTKETAVSSRDAAANKLRAKGIDPSTIKTASDLEKLSSKDTDAMYWASQYLAGVSAVNDATSQLSSVQEDYASTVSSVTDNIIDERNKLYENERSKEQSKHSNEEKKWSYTDSSLQDRLDTIDAKLDHAKTDTIDSYKEQFDKSFKEADRSADVFYGYKTMGYLDNQPAWVQKIWNQTYDLMANGRNFNPETDDIAEVYIPSDVLEEIKKAVQEGYLPATEYENAVKYNANISDGNNQYQTYTNNKATYDYETLPNSFKEIFSTISDDADRTVSDIQRNIDAIENSLDNDLFTNKTDSYKKEADYYANQKQVYVDEGNALRKQLALAEAKGLKQGSDTWNELMDQIHTADDNAEKAAQSYTNAVVNAFNSIGDIADRKITEIGKSLSKLDTQMSLYETQGHFITSEFYNGQGDLYQQQREAELKKATDLQAELDADVASGDIKEYSARWYEMKDKIDEATQSADDYSVKIAESTNKAFDAILQLGEKSREAITRMNDEADFYQNILGRDKLVNEKTGAFTANGVASISLSYEKMTNDIIDNNNIKDEIERVKKRYNNGNNPKYGIEQYNKDMDNLLSQQREAIKNYYDEREAVMSLISDGLQKQLDVLQDIVDKTKEAMDRTSDLRDYQNNVEEATKNISSLEKQLAVVQGNDSEEGRATAQSIQKQLEDAQKNLDDLEWDKKKTDMTNILDDLMENAQDYVDEKLDQVSDTLDEIRDSLQKDAPKVIETLQGLDNLWGTSMSDAFRDAVSNGDYSTITYSIDSAASKIAQAVYDSEKAKLKSTPEPDITDTTNNTDNTQDNSNSDANTREGLIRLLRPTNENSKNLLINAGINTYNEESAARSKLDDLTNEGELENILGINGKIPDSRVDDALNALGLSHIVSSGAPLNYKIAALTDTLKEKLRAIAGFSKGGIIGALNDQVRKNNDDALISVQSGEGILTPQQTEMFQKLVGELPTLVNIADVKVPNFPTTQNTSKTVNVELGDMHFDLPNVTDTDSFINAWKTDNKMKNFVSDVVTGAVTGDNSKAMRY